MHYVQFAGQWFETEEWGQVLDLYFAATKMKRIERDYGAEVPSGEERPFKRSPISVVIQSDFPQYIY